ncbi:glycosyltransferase family 4 protein [Mucilaginibacter terrae]|uniref:glycosyltransferase family 4 protein n=1 Tax=Mucilaginibacter terrae TaxID=1955052 RepID=UPI00362CD74F
MSKRILYVFRGEGASGAEIVIERLIIRNTDVIPYMCMAPCLFAENFAKNNPNCKLYLIDRLKKLNRSSTSPLNFYVKALTNYFVISYMVLRYAKANQINAIHANTVVPAAYLLPALIYSKLFKTKIYWVWSDHDLKYFSKIDHLFSGWCVKLYNKTLVVSEAVKSKYNSLTNVDVLYNGLDINYFKPNLKERQLFRENHQIPENIIVLGLPAVVAPRKGQLELAKVFKSILLTLPNALLLYAGGVAEDSVDYSKEFFEEIMDVPQIRYIGKESNMLSYYNGCDIVINNSTMLGSEPLGTTIYEAMACEKIVLASETGGSPEIIDDHVNGFLFKPDNTESLKTALFKVLKDFGTYDKLRSKARKKVIEKFNVDTMIENYNGVLKSL